MKALKTYVLASMLLLGSVTAGAQTAGSARQRALVFADSILVAFYQQDWNSYLDLSYPGVVSYYGGHQGFEEYSRRVRRGVGDHQGPADALEIVQMLNRANEWQCVIRRTAQVLIDGKNAAVISYMIGQSTDQGGHWTYFDLAFNSPKSLFQIMPDAFEELSVPQRQVVFETDQVIGMH